MGKKRRWHKAINVALVLALVAMLAIFLLPQPAYADPDPGWYDANWQYRRQITIDHTQVKDVADPSTTYADFPALVYATGLSNIKADGADIRFTSSNGTAELPREIESYSGGTLYAWVKVTLTKDSGDSSDDVIYMYYGNAAATEPAPDSTYGSENVWSNGYAAVWHLHDDFLDSTQYDNDGTNSGSANYTGIIADAQYFDGSDEITRDDADLSGPIPCSTNTGGTEDFTLSAWINVDAIGSHEPILKKQSDGTAPERGFGFGLSSAGRVSFDVYKGDTSPDDRTEVESDTLLSADWYHVVVTYDYVSDGSSEIRLYIDGDQDIEISDTAVGPPQNNNRILRIGHYYWSSGYNKYLSGILDEVRVSSTARSDDWINTCYNNQNSPSTFYGVGDEEEKPSLSSQRWYLSSTAGSWVMYKGDHTKTAGTVPVADDGSETWIADEATTVDVGFPAGTWTGHITFDATSLDTTVRVWVGKWDGSIFTPSAADEYADVSGSSDFSFSASPFTVPETKWLALKIEDYDAVVDTDTVVVSVGGNNSYLTSPSSDPGYPIPELPTIILIGAGLACLGGYIIFMRRRRRVVSP